MGMLPNFEELCCLKRVEAGDAATLRAAATRAAVRGWVHYVPFLVTFAQSRERTLLWESVGGSVCLYFLRSVEGALRLDLYVPPFPFTAEAFAHARERLRRFNEDRTARITWVDAATAPLVEAAGVKLRALPAEYVYDAEAVRAAAGKRFVKLRQIVNRARRLPDLVVRPFEVADAPACTALLERWQAALQEKGRPLSGVSYTRRLLGQTEAFGPDLLRGVVVTVAGQVAGMAFGGPITDGIGSIFVTISDHGHAGLGYLLRAELMAAWPELPAFNDSDGAREGLAQVKETFAPTAMHAVHRAVLPRGG